MGAKMQINLIIKRENKKISERSFEFSPFTEKKADYERNGSKQNDKQDDGKTQMKKRGRVVRHLPLISLRIHV